MSIEKDKKDQIEQKNIKKEKKKFSPSIYAILISLSGVVVLISWIVYWAMGADPYGTVHPAGLLEIISAPIQGFIKASDVIIFLLCLSAFIHIVNQSKSLEAGIGRLFVKLKGKEVAMVLLLLLVFSVCGTTFGMSSATIPFYFMLLPILYAAGFDGIVAFLVICFGAGVGVMSSIINPLVVANSVSAVNGAMGSDVMGTMDGVIWRVICYVILLGAIMGYTLWYVKRVQKDITKSFVYESIAVESKKFKFDENAIPTLTTRRKVVLGIFITTFIILIVFAVPWDILTGTTGFEYVAQQLAKWFPYFAGQTIDPTTGQIVSNIKQIGRWSIFEMAFLFAFAAVAAYIVNWKSEKELGDQFIAGASNFVGVVFIVAISTGFSILLAETGIAKILINALGSMYGGMNPFLTVLITFGMFVVIAFFIPSMTGFSRAVFPIVGPAIISATTSGSAMTVSGAMSVFALASGWINIIAPTSFIVVVGLQMSGAKLTTYYKKCWPLYMGLLVLCILLCLGGVGMNLLTGSTIF